MDEKIEELKKLLVSIGKDSPLKENLENLLASLQEGAEDVLDAVGEKLESAAEGKTNDRGPDSGSNPSDDKPNDALHGDRTAEGAAEVDSEADTTVTADDDASDGKQDVSGQEAEDEGTKTTEDESSDDNDSYTSDSSSSFSSKIDELLNDDEFITASAGFVLGAAVVGLAALTISVLKK